MVIGTTGRANEVDNTTSTSVTAASGDTDDINADDVTSIDSQSTEMHAVDRVLLPKTALQKVVKVHMVDFTYYVHALKVLVQVPDTVNDESQL